MSESGRYFEHTPRSDDTGGPVWFDVNHGVPSVELAPDLHSRPVIGDGMALSYVSFGPNAVAPVHSHSEEQIVLVLEGECEFEVAGEIRQLRPGMGIVIPPHVPHGARTYKSPCKEVDIFHPPRQALVERLNALTSD